MESPLPFLTFHLRYHVPSLVIVLFISRILVVLSWRKWFSLLLVILLNICYVLPFRYFLHRTGLFAYHPDSSFGWHWLDRKQMFTNSIWHPPEFQEGIPFEEAITILVQPAVASMWTIIWFDYRPSVLLMARYNISERKGSKIPIPELFWKSTFILIVTLGCLFEKFFYILALTIWALPVFWTIWKFSGAYISFLGLKIVSVPIILSSLLLGFTQFLGLSIHRIWF